MKEVAGSLRLNLAQYRELAAFSQFASDLDEATQRQLNRGAKLTEMLKQGQYRPFPVEQQTIQLLAGVDGFLDDVELRHVIPFLEALTETSFNEDALLKEIVERGTLKKDNLRGRLSDVITSFKSTWVPA